MRLTKFKIQNYKKIEETDWINCSDLTAFVGKNEAGKSSLFRALSKINPSDGEKYDGLKEFPRKRYTKDFSRSDWPVSSAQFEIDSEFSAELNQINENLGKTGTVKITKFYSGKTEIEFSDIETPPSVDDIAGLATSLKEKIQCVTTNEENKGESLKIVKQRISNHIDSYLKNRKVDHLKNLMANFQGEINEDWQKKAFEECEPEINKLKKYASIHASLKKANELVMGRLPKFIYFDNYDVINSSVHIPTFIQSLNRENSPSQRTTKCLFEHVGLDLKEIHSLNPPQKDEDVKNRRMTDERAIKMSSASNAMTSDFSNWWHQRKHTFRYQLDGDYFRIWVSDDLDPSEIELEERSLGLRYFFSLYIVFLVEAAAQHKNCILLLDEPGLHYHGTQQGLLLKFFDELKEKNQIFYTTHSPFMIDGNKLENVRTVYEDESEGSVKVSEDIWPVNRETLFPLQAALSYSIAQTLFYSKKQIIVEGLTDYWYLKCLSEVLENKKRSYLDSSIAIVPAGGVKKLMPLASMLIGNEVDILVLVDSDKDGKRKAKELEKNILSGVERKCFFIGDYVPKEDAEIEDLFPEELYIKAVEKAYEVELIFDSKLEEENIGTLQKIEKFFEKNNKKFHKWAPARILIEDITKNPDVLPNKTLDAFDKMFNDISTYFKNL